MGDRLKSAGRNVSACAAAIVFAATSVPVANAAISGSDVRAISGSDANAISGSDLNAISGSDVRAISGSDLSAISGSDLRAISGSDLSAISGSDVRAISGSDLSAISGSDGKRLEGVNLLLLGRVSFVGNDFVSVLGQTVFIENASSAFAAGSMVAVYGAIDFDTGGIVGASILDAASAGFGASGLSFLTGFVDAVDYSKGIALVSGMAVDYNALLSVGSAPSVGDMVSVTGRNYGDLGVLVADPNLRLEIR